MVMQLQNSFIPSGISWEMPGELLCYRDSFGLEGFLSSSDKPGAQYFNLQKLGQIFAALART